MQDETRTTDDDARKRGSRRIVALLAGAALLIGGAFGAHAIAQSNAYGHVRLAAMDGGWHGRDHTPLAEMTDAEIAAHVTRMVRHVSIEIDATPAQEEEIIAVAIAVAKELRPMKARVRATGMELKHLLTADSIDRAALESLRAARLAEAERISKTLVGAAADVAELLTPEQREVLQALIRERHERRRRHGRRG